MLKNNYNQEHHMIKPTHNRSIVPQTPMVLYINFVLM